MPYKDKEKERERGKKRLPYFTAYQKAHKEQHRITALKSYHKRKKLMK